MRVIEEARVLLKTFAEAAGGVWRTIRGRRVFIRSGETPKSAFKRSIGLKGPISQSKALSARRAKLAEYLKGFWSRLKADNERRYVAARAKQLVNGQKRPEGFSAKFGISNGLRVRNLEFVTYKILQAGRSKFNV